MAVTKIWPVRGRLDSLIRYAENEEKTRMPDLTGLAPAKDDLVEVLQYAANHSKTTQDRQLFVSGVNCLPEIARQQMELTKRQFGDTAGIVAFQAYQSFPPGEVTPEDCPRRFPTIAHPIRPCERICANGSRLKPSCICWSKLGRKWGNSLRRKPRSCKLWRPGAPIVATGCAAVTIRRNATTCMPRRTSSPKICAVRKKLHNTQKSCPGQTG